MRLLKALKIILSENGYADAQITFNSAQNEVANCTSIAQKYVNDKVDLIYAVATPAAQAAANETKDIPIVISAVTDPADSGSGGKQRKARQQRNRLFRPQPVLKRSSICSRKSYRMRKP